jgi:cobalt-zinc-cadmium efflux system membrane fusion protein
MGVRGVTIFKYGALGVAVLAVVGIAAAAWRTGALPIGDWFRSRSSSDSGGAGAQVVAGKLIGDKQNILELSQDVAKFIGVQTAEVRQATDPRKLKLEGSLALNPDLLAHIRARFPGEVVELSKAKVFSETTWKTADRPVRLDDRVTKGEVLAVIWNTDLGNKKNDLIDAIAAERLDRKQLGRYEDLYKKNAISEATLEAARTAVEKDSNAISRAERTLRSLRVTDEEIKQVKAEADRLLTPDGKRDDSKVPKNWARVEVTAPMDGTIVEKNFVLGDIVDTSFDLFKIADLDKLNVLGHVYEEDLRALQALRPDQLYWNVDVETDPELKLRKSKINIIGPVIDPVQHTAVVIGEIDNPRHLLHAAQFITATVDLPPMPDEVVIPTTALIEDGRESTVFIRVEPARLPEADPKKEYFERRRVVVSRREQKNVYIRSELTLEQEKKGLQPLKPGEVVVKDGALILEATLEDLLTDAAKK